MAAWASEYSQTVGLDDLTLLSKVSDEEIAKNLRVRAEKDIIYTYIGAVLIAVNPYKYIKSDGRDIYSDEFVKMYCGKFRIELPPHIFATAEEAFRTMLNEEESQCIIISGESGAGKTVASKHAMSYIAAVSAQGAGVERVKAIVLESNPLLEAFGNAKTIRNNNSSRFGKYVEIRFDRFGTPKGGHIRNYILEKSRVPYQVKGERNFHIFYQLTKGAPAGAKKALKLTQPEDFAYLAGSACYDIEGVDDVAEFKDTQHAMKVVGLGSKGQEAVFKTVAGILHLGNVKFVEEGEGSAIKGGAARKSLEVAMSLLGMDAARMEQAIRFRHMVTRGEEYDIPQNKSQAKATRDAVSKLIYTRLFDWIVEMINNALEIRDELVEEDELLGINVLDIFGFEIFERNGFEQFLINFVNEKLQQIFIELTLKAEQEEYVAEGIEWRAIKFFNNKVVCELIEAKRPAGVLAILDDTCATLHAESRGADGKFLEKLSQFHSGHEHFSGGSGCFVIKHYAGEVRYTVDGFCVSNKDTLYDDVLAAIKTSSSKLIQALFPESVEAPGSGQAPAGQKKRPTTVGFKMKNQTALLVEALMSCAPHYVRCIKPNDVKKANTFEQRRIVHQVKYLGLLENVRVRRAGFAYRQEFHRFTDRYTIMVSEKVLRTTAKDTDRSIAKRVLSHLAQHYPEVGLTKEEAQLGKTKLFIKQPETLFRLEEIRQGRCGEAAAVIQRAWVAFKKRKHYIKLRANATAFVSKNKARRRESILRPFDGAYIKYHRNASLRKVVEAKFKGAEKVVFADEIEVLVAEAAAADVRREKRIFVVTDAAIYMVEHVVSFDQGASKGPGESKVSEQHFLRRWISLKDLRGMSLSALADNFFVLHVSDFVASQATEWVEDKAAEACAQCKVKFWLFTRRHHCRQCGLIFCDACCPDSAIALPDTGHFEPTRVCSGCLGLESSEMWQDYVCESFRKTEIMAVLIDVVQRKQKRKLDVTFSNGIRVALNHVAAGKKLPERKELSLAFSEVKRSRGAGDDAEVRATAPLAVEVRTGPGVPTDIVERRKRRAAEMKKRREVERKREAEERKVRDAERERQREADRQRRIAEKRAKKAAEKEAKAGEERAKKEAIARKGAGGPRGSGGGGVGDGGGGGGGGGGGFVMPKLRSAGSRERLGGGSPGGGSPTATPPGSPKPKPKPKPKPA